MREVNKDVVLLSIEKCRRQTDFLLDSSDPILRISYFGTTIRISAKVVHRKFRHSATGIDGNPTGTPLEIGASLATDGGKDCMTFFRRDKRLFTGRNGHLFDRYA